MLFGYYLREISRGKSRRKKVRPMEQPQKHPMENLLLFIAKTLRLQYVGRPEEQDFARLIAAAQADEPEQVSDEQMKAEIAKQESDAPETGTVGQSDEHEQGKPPPAPQT